MKQMREIGTERTKTTYNIRFIQRLTGRSHREIKDTIIDAMNTTKLKLGDISYHGYIKAVIGNHVEDDDIDMDRNWLDLILSMMGISLDYNQNYNYTKIIDDNEGDANNSKGKAIDKANTDIE